MSTPNSSTQVPFQENILNENGSLSLNWLWFFRGIWERIFSLGQELSFNLANNQSTAADIIGLKFNKRGVSQATVDFLIQIITTGSGATELIESGIFIAVYNPTSQDWSLNLVSINNPDNSGVDFTIKADGQVQYTSGNQTGTASISRVVWRARTLKAKSSTYSDMGTR